MRCARGWRRCSAWLQKTSPSASSAAQRPACRPTSAIPRGGRTWACPSATSAACRSSHGGAGLVGVDVVRLAVHADAAELARVAQLYLEPNSRQRLSIKRKQLLIQEHSVSLGVPRSTAEMRRPGAGLSGAMRWRRSWPVSTPCRSSYRHGRAMQLAPWLGAGAIDVCVSLDTAYGAKETPLPEGEAASLARERGVMKLVMRRPSAQSAPSAAAADRPHPLSARRSSARRRSGFANRAPAQRSPASASLGCARLTVQPPAGNRTRAGASATSSSRCRRHPEWRPARPAAGLARHSWKT